MTAGHCICYQNKGKYLLFNPKEISIVQYSESVEKVHRVLDIVKSDTGESDYAVLEIEKLKMDLIMQKGETCKNDSTE